MSSSLEVKKEIVGKLSEANANEKYLYSRVMELEKRNQKLEKKVNKLKRKKKELKQEVLKLRSKIQSQGSEEVEDMTGQDEDQRVSKMTICNILKSLPKILNIRTHHRDARNVALNLLDEFLMYVVPRHLAIS